MNGIRVQDGGAKPGQNSGKSGREVRQKCEKDANVQK